ncbi:hypothetical protein C0993_001809, partial [Termitomyces sp. T159_Od127]
SPHLIISQSLGLARPPALARLILLHPWDSRQPPALVLHPSQHSSHSPALPALPHTLPLPRFGLLHLALLLVLCVCVHSDHHIRCSPSRLSPRGQRDLTTAFILPFNPPVPQFLCIVEGFTLSIRTPKAINEFKEEAPCIITMTLLGNEEIIAFIKSKIIGNDTSQHNLDPAKEMITLIEVKLIKGDETTTWAVKFGAKKPM